MSTSASDTPYWLGIDLGGTKILAEVYDADWNLKGDKKRKTKAERGQKAGLERMLKTARQAIEAAGIAPEHLSGIGIGCPGVVDAKKGVLVRAPNLGWDNVKMRKLLQDEFNVPVAVANDVDAGTYGEATRGAGKGGRVVFGVFPGTGIGAGLVHEDRIYTGSRLSCLELGHLQVVPDGPRCGCGRRGCLEAVAGRLAISSAVSAAVLRGQAPWLREHVGSDPAAIRSSALADAVDKGDDVVRDILEQAFDALGSVLGGMVNLLGPDVMVIGGGLAEAMPDLLHASIQRAMEPKIMRPLQGSCDLRIAKLGDHATTLGAAAWVRHEVEA